MTEYCPTDCTNLVCGVCCRYKKELVSYTFEDDRRRHYERLPECAAAPFPPDVITWHGMEEKPKEHAIVLVIGPKFTQALQAEYEGGCFWSEHHALIGIKAWAYLPGRSEK